MKLIYSAICRAIPVVLLATSATTSLGESTHYRWLNDRGEPVYSDRPPEKGVDYEVISSKSSLKRVVSAEEGAVPAEANPRPGNEFDQVDSAAASRYKKNPELCQRASKNLEFLNRSVKIQVRDAQGELRTLSPEEIEVQRQTAEAQVSVYCE